MENRIRYDKAALGNVDKVLLCGPTVFLRYLETHGGDSVLWSEVLSGCCCCCCYCCLLGGPGWLSHSIANVGRMLIRLTH